MSKLDLEAIKARTKVATPGPWLARATDFDIVTPPDEPGHVRVIVCGYISENDWQDMRDEADGYTISTPEDREFLAHARADVPALVAEVERLREESQFLRMTVNRLWADCCKAVNALPNATP